MSPSKKEPAFSQLRTSLEQLPFITQEQIEQWLKLQRIIDASRDYLVRSVPQAQSNIEEAQKILSQRTYTLVFFGGTGVGKSTLINALLGRNLLPTGAVTAVTGTIVYIEQTNEKEEESLVFDFWSQEEFVGRVRRLCQLAEFEAFDIADDAERSSAREEIESMIQNGREEAKTEQDEYLEILIDCIRTYEHNKALLQDGPPPSQRYALDDIEALTHLREDGFKGSDKRLIRLIRSATFRIKPRTDVPNLLMNGYLRIVDVPGLGAGMRLHEAITLEEMKREDAMIVLVTDAGRQRVDEMKSLSAVNWIKEKRLYGLKGSDLDEAASKIFVAINGGNIRQAFDRLNAGLPESEREVREYTRYISPNYWERYADRGDNRPYFLVMAPIALYLQDPQHAPEEFASETERVLKVFSDQLGQVSATDPLDPESAEALLKLSEIPLLRERLLDFITKERVLGQLREATMRVRNALQALRFYYERQLATRGVHPPFADGWESLQEQRYENVLIRHQKELPRAYHNALLDLSQRINSDARFLNLIDPTLGGVKSMVLDAVEREVETLLESYGTEHWDDRDVTYDNLVWGTSGIEVPIKRILYQVELVMQEAVSSFMPEVAEVVSDELQSTLEAHNILGRLERASYGQPYTYSLPQATSNQLTIGEGFSTITTQVRDNFRQASRQAAMYELMKPSRSVHFKVKEGEEELTLPEDDRLLDVILNGADAVRKGMPVPRFTLANEQAGTGDEESTERIEEEFVINILEESETAPELDIKLGLVEGVPASGDLETSYAEKLDTISSKTIRIFAEIIENLFKDKELLSRLRRMFWLEATRSERDFNNLLVKPMLKQHDRQLGEHALRKEMEVDLESMSDVEELMRVWEGIHALEVDVSS